MTVDQGTATIVAASVAAALALVNIVATIVIDLRRQHSEATNHTLLWLRDQLHRNAIAFLDASFEISSISRRIAKISNNSLYHAGEPSSADLIEVHERLKLAQTELRILCDEKLISAIEDCHDAHDRLFEMALDPAHPARTDSSVWKTASDEARRQRARFVTMVRVPLGLKPFDHTIRHNETVI